MSTIWIRILKDQNCYASSEEAIGSIFALILRVWDVQRGGVPTNLVKSFSHDQLSVKNLTLILNRV